MNRRYWYRRFPFITRECFYDSCMERGISLKECPFEWTPILSNHGNREILRPVAIERATYGDSPVALYAVIYRDCYSGHVRQKMAWGKLKNLPLKVKPEAVGESE